MNFRGPWSAPRIGWAVFQAAFIGAWAVIMTWGWALDPKMSSSPAVLILVLMMGVGIEALIEAFCRWLLRLLRNLFQKLPELRRGDERKPEGERIGGGRSGLLPNEPPEQPGRRRIRE